MDPNVQIGLILLVSAAIAGVLVLFVPLLSWWVQAFVGGCRIPIWTLLLARFHNQPVHELLVACLVARRTGFKVPFERFAELRQLGGQPVRVATMLAAFGVSGIQVDPDRIFRLELQGRLAEYLEEWRAAAADGRLPPDLPSDA
ncbi:MAG TPA: hypothetical protein P5137_04105 [Candidatus Brocadiia bacterium]|nr:hypothetical protein [Candidatus Brocadiia bacterium]